jgi:hypothetical protein
MTFLWSLLFLALWTSGSPAPEQRLDFSCARFHPFLTEENLITEFGRDNVNSGPVFGDDDGPAEGSILFANREDMKVEIQWVDPASKQKPLWIRVRGEFSRWQTPNGLKLGDDLRTIERRNGFPFRLAGFSSEMHGALRDWGVGRLRNTPNCRIGITFQPQRGTGNPLWIRQVTSRRLVSSGHPAMQGINPRVVALWISYPTQLSRPANAADALLDVLLFGMHMPIDAAQYEPDLRSEVQQYLRRAVSYNPRRAVPPSREMGMVYAVPDTDETLRQHVEQESANELVGGNHHRLVRRARHFLSLDPAQANDIETAWRWLKRATQLDSNFAEAPAWSAQALRRRYALEPSASTLHEAIASANRALVTDRDSQVALVTMVFSMGLRDARSRRWSSPNDCCKSIRPIQQHVAAAAG